MLETKIICSAGLATERMGRNLKKYFEMMGYKPRIVGNRIYVEVERGNIHIIDLFRQLHDHDFTVSVW